MKNSDPNVSLDGLDEFLALLKKVGLTFPLRRTIYVPFRKKILKKLESGMTADEIKREYFFKNYGIVIPPDKDKK